MGWPQGTGRPAAPLQAAPSELVRHPQHTEPLRAGWCQCRGRAGPQLVSCIASASLAAGSREHVHAGAHGSCRHGRATISYAGLLSTASCRRLARGVRYALPSFPAVPSKVGKPAAAAGRDSAQAGSHSRAFSARAPVKLLSGHLPACGPDKCGGRATHQPRGSTAALVLRQTKALS